MSLLAPALPTIALPGASSKQRRIRERILALVPADGIHSEELFDALATERPEDSIWMVLTMIDSGELREDETTQYIYV